MSPENAQDHQPTVLIVEDDENIRDAMTRLLVAEGYLVLTAASAHDALGMLQAPLSKIDVVLLDVHLPDGNGASLCARLREQDATVPIVVCTGEAEPEEAAELLKLGIHRYFRKPVSADELLATVESALP